MSSEAEKKADRDETSTSPAGDAAATEVAGTTRGTAFEGKPTPPSFRVTPGQWAFLLVVALATAGLDLWSKAWAIRALSLPNPSAAAVCSVEHAMQRDRLAARVVVPSYLEFRYAENCGGAWGLLHGTRESLRKPFFLLVTIGAVLFILHLYRSLEPEQRAMRWALPLVLGGAIGNLVDRIRLGYVVDFIRAHWQNRHEWPTFNVADIAITVGIGLMLLEYIVGPKRAPGPKPKVKPAAG